MHFDDPEVLVERVVSTVGKTLIVGLPVGIGKAVHVANALFDKARIDPDIRLTIFTGLTLTRPRARNDLEARLLEPLVERWYGEWPELEYVTALRDGNLPPNVSVREFYLQPGAWLGNPLVQQAYTSINYSKVVDELIELGVNVIAQLVAVDESHPDRFSLSSNPEVTLDLLPKLEQQRAAGKAIAVIGQVNRSLPYMPGDPEVPAAKFDFVLDSPAYDFPPFALPGRRVSPADYATGMHVASLVPDGGTLQVGIGSLSEAVAHCLRLRHEQPDVFRSVLAELPGGTGEPHRQELPLESDPFELGLYSCTELLSDAIFSLLEAGVVKRPAGAGDDALIHAGFFIGSKRLYAGLRDLPIERRRRIRMTNISFVNTLFGDEERKRSQRTRACFVNETMMANLLGSAVSDALEDGRVVSGIGGQFDFVQMASTLQDARSILMLRSCRQKDGARRSNIHWNYAHTSVPRQNRDIYVNEYGIASTRGKPDADVISAMLNITDASFQVDLTNEAIRAGKLPKGFTLSHSARRNNPRALERVFSDARFAAHFPPYPLGCDFDDAEQRLVVSLEWLAESTAGVAGKLRVLSRALAGRPDKRYVAELERMGLADPKGLRDRLLARLVSHALEETST